MRPLFIKTIAVASLALSASWAFTGASLAEIYEWKDSEGIVHLTDDLGKVPERYREKARRHAVSAPAAERETPAAPPAPWSTPAEPQPEAGEGDFYGEYPLEWWAESFKAKREALRQAEDAYNVKKQYIGVFDAGRRFGQVYGQSEVDTYARYRAELPADEKKMEELRADLAELQRKAAILGVPRQVRGE